MERRGEADDAAGGNGRDKDVSVDKVVASGLRAGGGTIAGSARGRRAGVGGA